MRSICLLGAQVAVEGDGWMVLAVDNYDIMAYFELNDCVQRNLYSNCVLL